MSTHGKSTDGISRRDFLKSAAAASAAGFVGAYIPNHTNTDVMEAGYMSTGVMDELEVLGEAREAARKNVVIEKLLEPGKIGKVQTRNRMVKTAAYGWILWDMQNQAFKPEGLAYYEAIAKGGVGLMVMEDPAFRPDTIGRPLFDDASIEVEKQLVDVIHKHGCPTFAQLTDFRPLMGIAASSAYYYPSKLDMNNAMPALVLSVTDIQDNTEMVAKCAERCMKAGYDGVEINTGCSHMFATFTSRFWNKREDEYGAQNFENRARIVMDMIKAIKKRCGQDFPVGILMNGFEMDVIELGNNTLTQTIEEGVELAKLYEEAGADEIQVRSHSIGNHINGFFPDFYYMFGEKADTGFGQEMDIKKYWPEFITEYGGAGGFIETAARYKKELSIPVMTVGSMDPRLIPDLVENAVKDGKIDFVAMTRPLTADPELPNKIAAGKINDVRPCAHCITCFPMTRCRVNAAAIRANGPQMPEGYDVAPAQTKKKVMVVGGGPAGLEAARVAALRGHSVTLYEKTQRLGGLMPVAAVVKGEHEKILDFVTWLSEQITALGVNVKMGEEVNAATVDKEKPDVVIVATGGVETKPAITGIENNIVKTSESLHKLLETGLKVIKPFSLRKLSKVYMPVGKKVVIIGGQIQGVQLAEFLAQHDRDVTIVDEGPAETIGLNLPMYVKERVVLYNQSHGVKTLMGVKIHEITNDGIKITTSYGVTKTIPADDIVIALPTTPNSSLVDSMKGKVSEVYAIGDCNAPGVMVDAVEAGNLTARMI